MCYWLIYSCSILWLICIIWLDRASLTSPRPLISEITILNFKKWNLTFSSHPSLAANNFEFQKMERNFPFFNFARKLVYLSASDVMCWIWARITLAPHTTCSWIIMSSRFILPPWPPLSVKIFNFHPTGLKVGKFNGSSPFDRLLDSGITSAR